jgi:hypothetical protein
MRFGIALSLWSKQEWDDLDRHKESAPAPAAAKRGKTVKPIEPTDGMMDADQRAKFDSMRTNGLDHVKVAANARVDWHSPVPTSKLPALRDAFEDLVEFQGW